MHFQYNAAEWAFHSFPGPSVEAIPAVKRVEQGIAFCERNNIAWFEVDLKAFDLASSCNCVVGQVYERFPMFVLHVAEDFHTASDNTTWMFSSKNNARLLAHFLGLAAPSGDFSLWEELEQEWIRRITERQAKEATNV